MDEYMLHEEYYKSVRGEDGEEPLKALGSPPYTDMGSYLYSGPPTDLADTVSLPRQPRGPAWRPEVPTTSRNAEVCPAYVEDSHLQEPTYGALDRTAELLAKLLSGSGDPDVTALSEAVKAKLVLLNPYPSQRRPHPLSDEAHLLKITNDQECPGCYPRSLAPAVFVPVPGQSPSLSYKTCQ